MGGNKNHILAGCLLVPIDIQVISMVQEGHFQDIKIDKRIIFDRSGGKSSSKRNLLNK